MWAVDDAHLPDYLLPRECPRVCWRGNHARTGLLDSAAQRVIAIEHGWLSALSNAGLQVHALDPSGFVCLDAGAGYWVGEHEVNVVGVTRVDDCVTALAERDAELRAVDSLWPYVDAVVAAGLEFSAIRMRNAVPRPP